MVDEAGKGTSVDNGHGRRMGRHCVSGKDQKIWLTVLLLVAIALPLGWTGGACASHHGHHGERGRALHRRAHREKSTAWLGGFPVDMLQAGDQGDADGHYPGTSDHDHLPPSRGDLKAVVIVARHADRAPQNHAPAYATGTRHEYFRPFPFDNTTWDVDYGQLTGLGMRQCFNFGRFLRRRYISGHAADRLLRERYDHAQTHVRATDVDRTLVSAQAVMQGLYPAKTGPRISREVEAESDLPRYGMPGGLQMVPVHTRLYRDDRLLDGSGRGRCPRWDTFTAAAVKSSAVYGSLSNQSALLEALPALTGYGAEEIAALPKRAKVGLVAALRDVRVCQRSHRIPVPPNISAFDEALEQVTVNLNRAKWDASGMGALVGGRLLRSIATRLQTAVAGENGDPEVLSLVKNECNQKGHDGDEVGNCWRKLVYYSGHDTTVFDLRAALGVPAVIDGIAPYLSHVIFELRRVGPEDDAFQVAVLAGHYAQRPLLLRGPFCGGHAACAASQFMAWVNDTVPEDVTTACAAESESWLGRLFGVHRPTPSATPHAVSGHEGDGTAADARGDARGRRGLLQGLLICSLILLVPIAFLALRRWRRRSMRDAYEPI